MALSNLVDGVGGDAHEVGVLALEHRRVRVAAHLGEVGHGPAALVRQGEEGGRGLAAAGDVGLHLVDEVLHAEGHGIVLARVERDGPVSLGDRDEFYLVQDAELLKEGVEVAAAARGAEVAELVERGLELEAPSDEAGGEAAREIVPLREQHLFAGPRQRQRRYKPAVARADDYGVVVQSCQILSPYLSLLFLWPYHKYIPAFSKME